MPAGKLTQPLKWPGGKNYMAKHIIELMPPHLHYVEPYFGGGAVLLQRDPGRDWFIDDAWKLKNGEKVPAHLRGCSEVVNDINHDLTNFWMVLANPTYFAEFQRLVAATPFCEAMWNDTDAELHPDYGDDSPYQDARPVRAWRFFVRCRQSRSGMMKDFATLTRNRTRGGINEQVSAWLGCVEGLTDVHARLRNVVILNQPAVKVIRSQDGPHTLFYCDPPYIHETRSSKDLYQHEMSPDEHLELLKTLGGIQGKFLLSGYDHPIYRWAEGLHGWKCHEFEIDNKLAGGKKKGKETECVWSNY